ncbi:polyphosphate kinase 1 [Senegalimassilia sp.]|uniref:polyphosphate kinase 1 n=1 Tax=Senegalimassilia sp. TaxID=1922200 RepID=UPI00283BE55A|nr:polyphosphate kinase 1 [Senegalimassilia sp.]MDR3885812.1 polyphosphate kinase 1 [Senegalimassilia sp.]
MKANESTTHIGSTPYMQNRELSWLTFNERVLDQGADETVPLLERLNFISIFWSNLQEFFMVRVGSLTDLSLLKKQVLDSKTGMTPAEQLSAIHKRCHELYPVQEQAYAEVRQALAAHGVRHLRPADLNDEQCAFLADYTAANIMPFLSPQIINSRHPFPHLENGSLYVIVRLNEEVGPKKPKKKDKAKDGKTVKAAKIHPSAEENENLGAEGVTVGILPMPRQCARVIKLPGEGFQFILLEHAVEMTAAQVFSMYTVKHTNVLCVTRNADLDATENTDESDEDYREHMKRILKKRGRLAPVRLESERPLSSVLQELLLDRLNLKPHQTYVTSVPLDMSWTWGLGSNLPEQERMALSNPPFTPQWPACLDRNRSIIEQVCEREVLLSYPYESMDAFVQLLREAAADPTVISIKITLYRLARQSHLAEALIAAAESGKQVTALFELRARFDESNNIEWSQRFEEAGCNVIYGFRDYKVHGKICCITRQTENALQYITQLGTGNYNEKTAKLYTDLSFITADETIGRDATEFFRNMQLENTSDNYDILSVAPLQIKPGIIANIDEQIALAREGKPCGLFFKTNSVTDKDIIVKIAEASQAGVPVTLLVRGISCLVPGVPGYTDNVRVVSIVGRLLEHSRIYGFGPRENIKIYLSSADLMTRNMEKRVEIAWPILDEGLRNQVLDYIATCLRDTAKLRELKADGTYTKLGELAKPDEPKFESQDFLIKEAQRARAAAAEAKAARNANSRKLMNEQRQAQMAEAEAKVEVVAKAEAAAAEAAREAEAAHKAALEAEAAAKAAEAETAAKPAAKPQPAPKPQAAPKPAEAAAQPADHAAQPAEAAAQPVPVKAQVINEPMQAPSHSGIQRRPEKPSLLARVLAKFIR